jgi:hypothetical protein
MGEKTITSDKNKPPVMILGAIGLILAIVGALVILVPGMPFRGSGIGTICVLLGVALLVVAGLRLQKRNN